MCDCMISWSGRFFKQIVQALAVRKVSASKVAVSCSLNGILFVTGTSLALIDHDTEEASPSRKLSTTIKLKL